MGLKLTLSLMPPYVILNTPAHRQQQAFLSRWFFIIRPICGRHLDPIQNPPPEPGHPILDPENACDRAPLIRFARRPLLGGDNICAARSAASLLSYGLVCTRSHHTYIPHGVQSRDVLVTWHLAASVCSASGSGIGVVVVPAPWATETACSWVITGGSEMS